MISLVAGIRSSAGSMPDQPRAASMADSVWRAGATSVSMFLVIAGGPLMGGMVQGRCSAVAGSATMVWATSVSRWLLLRA
jgi:hypothetical protein